MGGRVMDTTTPRPTRTFWNPDRSIRAALSRATPADA